jgi:Na+/H+-dicarboxylate symporter
MSHPPLTSSPAWLLIALVAGAALGAWTALPMTWITAAGQGYIAVLNMVGLPLIVLSVWSGLRQWPAQPGSAGRLLAITAGALLAMVLFALLGAVIATLTAGRGLALDDAQALGRLALQVEPRVGVTLVQADPEVDDTLPWDRIVPDNGYRALAYGTLASALIGVLFFGIGLAAQSSERHRAFLALAQGVQRSLEILVERIIRLLPIFAFALAASVVHTLGRDTIVRLQGFVLPLVVSVMAVVCIAVMTVAHRASTSSARVLGALRGPMVVALFSSGPAAAVPPLIDALSNQLGFRRDLLALAAPMLPTFLRVGDAVFLAVLTVFVAHLYGKTFTPLEVLMVAAASAGMALASVVLASGWMLAAAGLLLAWLALPFEALLPTFVALEVLTAGLRNLMSVLIVAPLLAWVARDLLSQPPSSVDTPTPQAVARYALVLRGRQALALGTLLALAFITTWLAGVGVGLRTGQDPQIRHTGSTPWTLTP